MTYSLVPYLRIWNTPFQYILFISSKLIKFDFFNVYYMYDLIII